MPPSGRASPRPPFPLLLFLLPSLKTRIAFYRPREFTPSRSLLADETRKITRNHANLRNVSFRFVSFTSVYFSFVSIPRIRYLVSLSLSLSILSPLRTMTTRTSTRGTGIRIETIRARQRSREELKIKQRERERVASLTSTASKRASRTRSTLLEREPIIGRQLTKPFVRSIIGYDRCRGCARCEAGVSDEERRISLSLSLMRFLINLERTGEW